jgi:glyoxylase-like metal-dependent hydrolase (beta-lactamase superfamily II)
VGHDVLDRDRQGMSDEPVDDALDIASAIVNAALTGQSARADVASFFDPLTCTASHVVSDPATGASAIIDAVLDFSPDSAQTSTASAQKIIEQVSARGLSVEWLLETHPHADHLSAAVELRRALGGTLAIGRHISSIQDVFARIFNLPPSTAHGFDRLFADGERFKVGALDAIALHVPGHTPACMAYVIADAVFIGDTMFMPDSGTARCDFPGGDASVLYRSVRRLQRLPDATRVLLCHDYLAPGRERYSWETTMAEQRESNIHLREGVSEDQFVTIREARDRSLPTPRLYLPSMQVNSWGGRLPDPEANGVQYLKLPLNVQLSH